jgi:hypothetical protein
MYTCCAISFANNTFEPAISQHEKASSVFKVAKNAFKRIYIQHWNA